MKAQPVHGTIRGFLEQIDSGEDTALIFFFFTSLRKEVLCRRDEPLSPHNGSHKGPSSI